MGIPVVYDHASSSHWSVGAAIIILYNFVECFLFFLIVQVDVLHVSVMEFLVSTGKVIS